MYLFENRKLYKKENCSPPMVVPEVSALSSVQGYDYDLVPSQYHQRLEGVVLRNYQIQQRVRELSDIIGREYKGQELVVLCLLEGAKPFYDLLTGMLEQQGVHVQREYCRLSSYVGNASSGEVAVEGLNVSAWAGKPLLIVEDLIDTGLSMACLLEQIQNHPRYTPRSANVVAFLDKPEGRKGHSPRIDYCGFRIPNFFVFGFGLDIDNDPRTRRLPHIYACRKS